MIISVLLVLLDDCTSPSVNLYILASKGYWQKIYDRYRPRGDGSHLQLPMLYECSSTASASSCTSQRQHVFVQHEITTSILDEYCKNSGNINIFYVSYLYTYVCILHVFISVHHQGSKQADALGEHCTLHEH